MRRKVLRARKKILLIDDKPNIQLFCALQEEGYEVIACESPQKAWNLVFPYRPHFIIVHLQHPSAKDSTALQECRALAEGVPIIVATSVPGNEVVMRALEDGATSFLPLPVKSEIIKKVLDGLESKDLGDLK